MRLQDWIVELVQAGFNLDYVLNLPLPNLNSLIESVLRVRYRDKHEDLWSGFVAAQGTQKGVKERAKGFSKLAGEKPPTGNLTDFLGKFGRGV